MRLFLPLLLLLPSLLRADSVSELKTTLARLNGREMVRARLEFEFDARQGEEKTPEIEQGGVAVRVEDGPEGLQVLWSREVLDAAARERESQQADAGAKTPTQGAIDRLAVSSVHDYLNAGADLLRELASADLVEEKNEEWEGRPARQLVFELKPPMSERERKYIKKLQATARVWVGADGVPLAARSDVYVKGRAMLVIGFESTSSDHYRFARVGDRLVVVEHVSENSGSGGGESGRQKTVAKLQILGS